MRWAAAILIFALAFLAGASARAEPVRLPAVDYQLRVLPNGLKVYSVPDASRTDVSVQVWYDVGSKEDPSGRSGLAHLVEHLMFKGTRDMPAEYIDQLTERVGGFGNASTNLDYTEFHETVPTSQLEPILWAEAQRMDGLVIRPADLTSERAVVDQELRENVLDDPYGRLFLFDIPAASFATGAYQRPAIGSLSELKSVTLQDVQAFHARYYRPDNASLVIVGRFDPSLLAAWVDKYFGAIAQPSTPLSRVSVAEPPRGAPRAVDTYLADPPDPAVVLSYVGPPAASADVAALSVLNTILAAGDSSRASTALVSRRGVASDVFSDVELHQGAGLIYVGAIAAPHRKPAQVEEALRGVVAEAREIAPSPAELQSAKTQLTLEALKRRETLEGLATELGQAMLVKGDPAHVNTDLAAILAVTATEVQRVARTYLLDEHRVTIRYHAAQDRHGPAPKTAPDDTPTPTVLALGPPPPPPARSRRALREPAAAGGGAQQVAFPTSEERTLANGLRVIVARSGSVPLATAVLAVRGGTKLDPPRKAGLTQLSTGMWLSGSPDRSATELAAAFEQLGLSDDSGVDVDASRVSITGLAASLPQGLALMADAVRRPRMDEAQLRRARDDMAEAVSPDELDSDALADKAVDLLVYGTLSGSIDAADPRTVSRITRADVLRQHERLFRPDNAVLVLTGDVEPQAGFALAEQVFGDWSNPSGAAPEPAPVEGSSRGRAVVIDVPDAPLAEVIVAGPATGRSDPERYAVELANSAFGGTYTSRLVQEIRIRRGLTYDVGSTLEQRHRDGMFQARAETPTETAGQVATLMLQQLGELAATGVSSDELGMRKAMLLGDLGRTTETSEDLADLLAHEAIYDRPAGELADYPTRLAAVSDREVRTAAARLADPSKLSVVIVADARRLPGDLRRRFPHLTVVTPATLDRVASR